MGGRVLRVAIGGPTGDGDRPVGRHAQDEDELFQIFSELRDVKKTSPCVQSLQNGKGFSFQTSPLRSLKRSQR